MSNAAIRTTGPRATQTRSVLQLVAVGAPPLILAILGLTHPVSLTDDTAEYWRNLHIILLPIFPLLGLAPWLIARRYGSVYGWVTAVLGYLYAVFYTSLDVLAGIGAGGLRLDNAGSGRGVLYDLADALVLGNCDLWQLSPALKQFWVYAFEEGRTIGLRASEDRIARLIWDRDRLYFRAFNEPYQERTNYQTFAELEADRDLMYAANRTEVAA